MTEPRKLVPLEDALYGAKKTGSMRDLIDNPRFACIFRRTVVHADKKFPALRLRFAEGKSYKDIAEILGTSVCNARLMVTTAIERFSRSIRPDELSKLLAPEPEDEGESD